MKIKDYMALLSKYRGAVMGVCTVGILFCHTKIILPYPFNYLTSLYWMTDIFFFFSGMGAYYSLRKDPDPLGFYKRRLSRVYLPYFPLILINILFSFPLILPYTTPLKYLQQSLGNLLMIGWFAELDNQLNWYPDTIMAVYLITPLLFLYVRSAAGNRKKLAGLAGFVILLQLCFLGGNYVIAVSRLICFLLGLLAADAAFRDAEICLSKPLLLLLSMAGNLLLIYCMRFDADLIWRYGVLWYPAIFVIPGMMYLFALFFRFLSERNWGKPFLRIFETTGKYSFEIFITHLIVYKFAEVTPLMPRNNLQWVVLALLTAGLAILYGKQIDRLRTKLKL